MAVGKCWVTRSFGEGVGQSERCCRALELKEKQLVRGAVPGPGWCQRLLLSEAGCLSGYCRVPDPPQLCAGHIWDRLEGPRELICSLLTAKAASLNCIKPTSSLSSKLSSETTCLWVSTGTCSLSPGISLMGMGLRRLKRETCYSQGGSWRFFRTKLHMGIAGREFAGDSFLIPRSCVDAAPISIRGWSEQPLRPGDSSAQARWKCLYK